jgi:hypothetical protein
MNWVFVLLYIAQLFINILSIKKMAITIKTIRKEDEKMMFIAHLYFLFG